jgi:NAD(P)-dependent dehydrogenase (short-subunit alcohol dehydrogenase family)
MTISDNDINTALTILEQAHDLDPYSPEYIRLEQGVAHLVKSGKKRRKKIRHQNAIAHDKAAKRSTGLASERFGTSSTLMESQRLRKCYVCSQSFRLSHHYYHTMCQSCGDANWAARCQAADLSGRRALVTGGRIKIGYATALSLLRMGAEVHVTSRFPADARQRYAAENDFDAWAKHLHLYGLDFRLLPDVMQQVEVWREGEPFDILINNAAQTVWHPPEYYLALYAGEEEAKLLPSSSTAVVHKHAPTQQATLILDDTHSSFPMGKLDVQGNPLDLRRNNSWVQELDEIAPLEMVEVQVINSMVPFLLCSRLHPNMKRSPFSDRYIVNVTAVEGSFSKSLKLPRHPHTNMAKAAMNMITRTSAQSYAKDGIYMTSVDPGWMSHEGPAHIVEKAYSTGFHPPLAAEDSAARILDPILRGILQEEFIYGVQLKDFAEVAW